MEPDRRARLVGKRKMAARRTEFARQRRWFLENELPLLRDSLSADIANDDVVSTDKKPSEFVGKLVLVRQFNRLEGVSALLAEANAVGMPPVLDVAVWPGLWHTFYKTRVRLEGAVAYLGLNKDQTLIVRGDASWLIWMYTSHLQTSDDFYFVGLLGEPPLRLVTLLSQHGEPVSNQLDWIRREVELP